MGEILGSIGEDGRFKLWQEEPTEVPSSGQRFKLLLTLSSRTNAPFMSLDFKNIGQETWLALITRDGHLSIYEPTDQSSLSDWRAIVEHWVTEEALRSEEVGFKVAWHKEKLPCWTAIQAGLDRKSLGLAVASLNEVQVCTIYPTSGLANMDITDLALGQGQDVLSPSYPDRRQPGCSRCRLGEWIYAWL